MSFTPDGAFTRMTYGPGFEGSPTTTASRTDGGNAGNGFQSISSGRTDLKTAWPGWWACSIAVLRVFPPFDSYASDQSGVQCDCGPVRRPVYLRMPMRSRTSDAIDRRGAVAASGRNRRKTP